VNWLGASPASKTGGPARDGDRHLRYPLENDRILSLKRLKRNYTIVSWRVNRTGVPGPLGRRFVGKPMGLVSSALRSTGCSPLPGGLERRPRAWPGRADAAGPPWSSSSLRLTVTSLAFQAGKRGSIPLGSTHSWKQPFSGGVTGNTSDSDSEIRGSNPCWRAIQGSFNGRT
jgi:hypothetical protein